MASSSDTILCSVCKLNSSTTKPKPGIVNCIGCQKVFCIHHIGEHRQELSTELEAIICQRNSIQEALKSSFFDVSAELALIDTWVKETIDLVHKTAANARQQMENLAIKHREDLKTKCQELTNQIESFQQSENYFERDLASLRTSFDQLAIAKNKSNIKVDFSDVGYAFDKAIQVNPDVRVPNGNTVSSFVEKVLLSKKPDRRVSIPGLNLPSITASSTGALLIDDYTGFLFVGSDGSMRSLSRKHRYISNIRWSEYLGCFLYYISSSHEEPTKLILFNPSASASTMEEYVTLKTEGSINCFAIFENSLLIVCALHNSTQTIEEWSLPDWQRDPSVALKYSWRSPLSCLRDEYIENIAFDRDNIALIIRTNKTPKNSYRFELRSRKMVVQGCVPLNLPPFLELSPKCALQRVPDGWSITYKSSSESSKFVLITNDLNLYEQSHLNNLKLTDLMLTDINKSRKRLLITYSRTVIERRREHQWDFSFYIIE
jgi:hypothetical protein